MNFGLTFGQALEFLKAGHQVAREGWNGKGMWIMLVPGTQPRITPESPYGKVLGEYANTDDGCVDQVRIESHIDMFTATGDIQPGWLASQADMLGEDWGVV